MAITVGMPPGKLGLVYSHTGIAKFIEAAGAARTRELFLAAGGSTRRPPTAGGWSTLAERRRALTAALAWRREIAADAPLAQRGNKRVIDAVLRAAGQLDPEPSAS